MEHIGIEKFLARIREKIFKQTESVDQIRETIFLITKIRLDDKQLSLKGRTVVIQGISPAMRAQLSLKQEQVTQALGELGVSLERTR